MTNIHYMNEYLLFLILCSSAYMIGAIPFAYLITYIRAHTDIRYHGSRNVGTTNAARIIGWPWALIVLGADVFKVIFILFITQKYFHILIPQLFLSYEIWITPIIGLCAIIGHIFPIYLRFHGGKGIATMAGCIIYTAPIIGIISGLMYGTILYFIGYSSLASLIAIATSFFLAFIVNIYTQWHYDTLVLCYLYGIFLVIALLTHHKNIVRLYTKKEPHARIWKKHQQQKNNV